MKWKQRDVMRVVWCMGIAAVVVAAGCERASGGALLSLPQTDAHGGESVTLAEDGSWGYNGPHALYRDGKLYWNHLDAEGVVWVGSHDVSSGEQQMSQVQQTAADLHQAGAIIPREDGHIQVFLNQDGVYSDDRIYWKVSEAAGDVSNFSDWQTSEPSDYRQGRQFYPMLHEPTGDIYMVLNARGPDNAPRKGGLWRSTDGGDTFEQHHVLFHLAGGLGSSGHRNYARAYLEGDSIHIVAMRLDWRGSIAGHNIGRTEGIYYTRYDIEAEAFYRADGTHAFDLDETPVSDLDLFDEIWHYQDDGDGQQRALWADIVARDGKPYIAFAVHDAVPGGTSVYPDGYWARPDEQGQWQSHKVAPLARGWDNTPQRKNYSIAIHPLDPYAVYVAKRLDDDEDLSQVHRMRTSDGGQRWASEAVLSEPGRISTVVVPWQFDDTHRVFDVLWMEGQLDGWRDYDTRIMTHAPQSLP